MNTPDRVRAAIDSLERYYWIDGLSAQLSGIYREHEQPTPPESGFSRTPRVLPFLSRQQVGNLNGYEQLAVAAYNEAVVSAYQCVDWQYVGLLTAISNDSKGSVQWNAYREKATEAINQYFIGGEAFKDFEAYMLYPAKEQLE